MRKASSRRVPTSVRSVASGSFAAARLTDRRPRATAFTLVGYAFHESFASAAHTLTHAALGAAVVAAAVLGFRAHRQARAASA